MKINKILINAKDIQDLWFQALVATLDHGRTFKIDCGSYAGQTRLELDYFTGHIEYPGTRPLLPILPPTIPVPWDEKYLNNYILKIMSPEKDPNEVYTYGSRLTKYAISSTSMDIPGLLSNPSSIFQDRGVWHLNQIDRVIDIYKTKGHRNNQMVMQIGLPTDLLLDDPACCRHIDTRIQDGFLHFFVYFRSWDLIGGLPANLAGIQMLKEYIASEIGVEDGEMIVESKGLHIYGFDEDFAKLRCLR